ncbi:MAG TPA: hypothetical protein PLO55_12155 [Thermotogota bacterium]|nr:hypothetical protein [Thermotogota bacterium]
MGVEYSGTRATPRMDLGVAVMEYVEQENEFIGTQVLPIFRTQKQKSVFPAITRESITRDADTKRATRGNYNRDGFSAKDKSYNCQEHGLEGALDDSERAMYASDFDAELVTSKITTRRVLQAQEKRIADLLFDTGVFAGSALYTDHSANPWSDIATKVVKQVRDAKSKVRANCGIVPNALVLSSTNIERLKANSEIIDLIKYTARPTDAEVRTALADLFGIKYIFEGKAIRNTAKEGKPFVSGDIWSDLYALLGLVITDGQDLSQPGLGRTFLWVSDSPENAVVEQYRAEEIRSDIFRVRQHVDEMVIDPYFAHLLKIA